MGPLMLESSAPGFDRGKAFSQKIAVAKIWIIINLEISMKGMTARADWTSSLAVQLNCSILEKCSLLGAQLRDITRSEISARGGSD